MHSSAFQTGELRIACHAFNPSFVVLHAQTFGALINIVCTTSSLV